MKMNEQNAERATRTTGFQPVPCACGFHNVGDTRCDQVQRSRYGLEARVTGRRFVARRLLACMFLIMSVAKSFSSAAFAADAAAVETRPNIVYILCDDLGYGDVHALNAEAKVATPNMDSLAREGMTFTDAHS